MMNDIKNNKIKIVKDNYISYESFNKNIDELNKELDNLKTYNIEFAEEIKSKFNKIISDANVVINQINETNKEIVTELNDLNKTLNNIETYIKYPWYKKIFKKYKN